MEERLGRLTISPPPSNSEGIADGSWPQDQTSQSVEVTVSHHIRLLASARARNAFPSVPIGGHADKRTMINEMLDLLLPKRTRERDVETFRRGLVRLMANRSSDNDPINRRAASKSIFDHKTSG